jgi:hypothetical protein
MPFIEILKPKSAGVVKGARGDMLPANGAPARDQVWTGISSGNSARQAVEPGVGFGHWNDHSQRFPLRSAFQQLTEKRSMLWS